MNDDARGMYIEDMKEISSEIELLVDDLNSIINDIRKANEEFFADANVNFNCKITTKINNSFSAVDSNFSVILESLFEMSASLLKVIAMYEDIDKTIVKKFSN